MTMIVKEILTAVFLGMILPGMLLNTAFLLLGPDRTEETIVEVSTVPAEAESSLIVRLRYEDDTVEEMDMNRYLVGVVLAEMQASFEEEALKAQAVAARTYAMKALVTGGKHGDGSVCMRSACCQGYLSDEAYLHQGGIQEGIDKIHACVYATSDQCLTYQGALIEATYYSTSGGYTEDAQAVWGTEFPYLQAVSSPGEEKSAYYEDSVTLTLPQFCQALGCDLDGDPKGWFGTTVYTQGGGVDYMVIGGQRYTGVQLRTLLGLRSTAFSVEAGDCITITTRGYGHRVGMS